MAHYRFNGDVSDETGNEYDGIEHGGVTYDSNGVEGSALVLDGVDDWVDIGPVFNTELANSDWTFSVFFKANSVSAADQEADFMTNYHSGTSDGFRWGVGSYDQTTFDIRFVYYSGPDEGQKIDQTEIDVPSSDWTHVAVAQEGGTLSLYVDGSLEGSLPNAPNLGNMFTTHSFRIGSSHAPIYWFDGQLDELRIYHRALSASEIQQLAQMAP